MYGHEDGRQAEFAKAEQNRKSRLREARANLEAEKLNAQAEVERAKGAAEAIRIKTARSHRLISSICGYVSSRISMTDVIYVPTETNLPLLEGPHATSRANPATDMDNNLKSNTAAEFKAAISLCRDIFAKNFRITARHGG